MKRNSVVSRHVTGALCLSLLAPLCANADLLFYDAFDEPAGTNPPAGWVNNQTSGLTVGIAPGSLSYPNLATSGNKWELDNTRIASTTITNKYTDTPLGSGETLYFSFLMNVAVAPESDAVSGIMRLGSSAGGNDVAAIGFGPAEDANPNQYRLSIDGQHRGFNHADSITIETPFNVGETILIVGSYTYSSAGTVNLWINPDPSDLGSLIPPEAHYTDPGHKNLSVDQYEIGFTGKTQIPGSWFLDEFRIGTSWAAVTPVPEPSTYAFFLGCGAIGLAVARRRKKARTDAQAGE